MQLTTSAAPRAPGLRRSGVTLVELIVVLVLLSIVAGGMLGIITRQQQFYTGSAGIIDTRGSVRQGMGVLQSALRGISPSNGDIYAMGRTFIEFRASTGASVLCGRGLTNDVIVLPPTGLSAGTALTSWIAPPVIGDSVLVYDTNRKPGTADDTWDATAVQLTPAAGATCPMSTGFTTTAAEAAGAWAVTLHDPLQSTVMRGAAIRFFRRTRYELYQASDGNWYLGYRDCMSGVSALACSGFTPITGPFLPAATTGPSGMELAYYDAAGAATTAGPQVRRIDIVLRARSASTVTTPGRPSGIYQDSLAASISVRN